MSNSFNADEWKKIIHEKKEELGYTWEHVEKLMGVSEKTRIRTCSKLPTERTRVLDLCYALKVSVEETNEILHNCNMQALYSKNPDDAIWIYIINKKAGEEIYSAEELFLRYSNQYDNLLKETIIRSTSLPTDVMEQRLLEAEIDEDFENCIRDNIKSFSEKYCRFERFICDMTKSKNVYDALSILPNDERRSAYSRIYNIKATTLQHDRRLFDIPKRPFMIALGLALSFDVWAINEMLDIGKFERIYGSFGDKTECAIYWLLIYLSVKGAPLKTNPSGYTIIVPSADTVGKELEKMNIVISKDYVNGEKPADFIYRILMENNYEKIPYIN